MKILILFFTALCAMSCERLEECPKTPFALFYTGYTPNEVDTIIVRCYQKDNTFSILKDSVLLTSKSSVIRTQNDTISVALLGNTRINDLSLFDLKIINPTGNKIITLSDLQYNIKKYNAGGFGGRNRGCCSSPFSYKVNGVGVVSPLRECDSPILYINR